MPRLGLISCWHVHARDYAAEAAAHPGAELVVVWDEDAARGRAAAARWGARFVERLDDLLADPAIDGVIVTSATAAHREIMLAAARAGKHIFTEKVIAPTRREAVEIVSAAAEAGVTLVVSLSQIGRGPVQAIKTALAEGRLGQVTSLRVRIAHDGALPRAGEPDGWLPPHFYDPVEAAGGALTDLGCHPLYLIRAFLGLPERVSASYGQVTGRAVEDNAVVTLGYLDGAIAVAETSFVALSAGLLIEAHGTAGSLHFQAPDRAPRLRLRGEHGGWTDLTEVPADAPSSFDQWVSLIEQRAPATENLALGVDLSALVEAANRSAAEQRVVALAELS